MMEYPVAVIEPAAPDNPANPGCDHRAAIDRIYRQFRWRNHWHKNYSRTKLKTDPLYQAVYEEIRSLPHDYPLTDLGCGLGICGMYLRQRGWQGDYLGLDFDQRKVRVGGEIMSRHYATNCRIEVGDLREFEPTQEGHMAVLDILQYFNHEQQSRLLAKAAAALAPGGRLLIRATLRDHSWRFRLNRWCDWFARCVLWMKSPPVHYTTREQLTAQLNILGLRGEFRPLWGKTPFCNWLGVFGQAPDDPTSRSACTPGA